MAASVQSLLWTTWAWWWSTRAPGGASALEQARQPGGEARKRPWAALGVGEHGQELFGPVVEFDREDCDLGNLQIADLRARGDLDCAAAPGEADFNQRILR